MRDKNLCGRRNHQQRLKPLLSVLVLFGACFDGRGYAVVSCFSSSSTVLSIPRHSNSGHRGKMVSSGMLLSNNKNGNDNGKDDIFRGFKNFFLFGNKNESNGKNNEDEDERYQSNGDCNYEDGGAYFDDDDDELPAGTTLLFKVAARQLKPGGLRLFLMFYLMGMQNTPSYNAWRADQKLMQSYNVNTPIIDDADNDDNFASTSKNQKESKMYVLEMLYEIDRTGMLQIEIIPEDPASSQDKNAGEIRLYRCGSRPSTSYLIQESIIIDGILDELQQIAGLKEDAYMVSSSATTREEEKDSTDTIADEDRLLIPDPIDAIDIARESLAFG